MLLCYRNYNRLTSNTNKDKDKDKDKGVFPKQEDYSLYTPVIQQYLNARAKTGDAILLFRFGDFYESFFDDALILSEKAEIALTGKRDPAYPGGRIPMAGIPHKTARNYIAKLLKAGVKIGICEQITEKEEKTGKNKIKRELVRVITPGTLLENEFLESFQANYLICLFPNKEQKWGIAAVDISTSEVLIWETSEQELLSEVKRLSPQELILAKALEKEAQSQVLSENLLFPNTTEAKEFLKQISWVSFDQKLFEFDSGLQKIKKYFGEYFEQTFDCKKSNQACLQSLAVCLTYLEKTYPDALLGLEKIVFLRESSSLKIDNTSFKNLEIFETYRTQDKKNSLWGLLEKYVSSAGGKRKLRKWLTFPLIKIKEIEERFAVVELLQQNLLFNQTLKEKLRTVSDLERLATKVAAKKINPRELAQIKLTLEALKNLSSYLLESKLEQFDYVFPRVEQALIDLLEELSQNFLEELPLSLSEGEIFSEEFNPEIKRLRNLKQNQQSWLKEYQEQQKKITQIKNLKISFNKIQGFSLEVSKANLNLVPDYYQLKQNLSNGNRYSTKELRNYEHELLSAESKLRELEQTLFLDYREYLSSFSGKLRALSEKVSKLDCLSGFAQISGENNYTRPTLSTSFELKITAGRHPVLEKELQANTFIANDLNLGGFVGESKNPDLILLTGPNMSGKSTFMKQTAIICIMAQIGCFVPAKEAQIGCLEQIFTRIGASDDLSQGQSTFMVEMLETAYLLNNMNKRSLLLLDEIGRGTSTYDGVAIAWSVAEYIAKKKIRCIFATHYHELNCLSDYFSSVENFQVTIEEDPENNSLVFLHKVKKGGANKSYGIEVAKIAGLPESVILRARKVIDKLSQTSKTKKKEPHSEDFDLQARLNIFRE